MNPLIVKLHWTYRLRHPIRARRTKRILEHMVNDPESVKRVEEAVKNMVLYGEGVIDSPE